MSAFLMTLLCVAMLAWFLTNTARGARERRDSRTKRATPNPYQAVSIVQRACSCDAVAEYDGQRFLASEAPLLPVPGCTAARCDCRYRRYRDRRTSGDRRTSLAGLQTQLYAATGRPERRKVRGRRRSDFEADIPDFGLEGIEWVN